MTRVVIHRAKDGSRLKPSLSAFRRRATAPVFRRPARRTRTRVDARRVRRGLQQRVAKRIETEINGRARVFVDVDIFVFIIVVVVVNVENRLFTCDRSGSDAGAAGRGTRLPGANDPRISFVLVAADAAVARAGSVGSSCPVEKKNQRQKRR